MEIEFNKYLPFLDVLISRLRDGSLTHQVFRKKTHTNRYLHSHSHYTPQKNMVFLKLLSLEPLKNMLSNFFPLKIPPFQSFQRKWLYLFTDLKIFQQYLHSQIHLPLYSSPQSQVPLPYIKGKNDLIAKILLKKY